MKKTLLALVCLATLQSCSSVKEYTGITWFESEEKQIATEKRRAPINNRAILNAPQQPSGYNMPNASAFSYTPQMPQAAQLPPYSSPNQPPLVIGQAQAPEYSSPVQMPSGSVLPNPYVGMPAQERRSPSFNTEAQGFEPNFAPVPSPVVQVTQQELPSEFMTPPGMPADRGIIVSSQAPQAPAVDMQYPKLAQIPPAPNVSAQPAMLDARVQELKRDLEESSANRANIEVSPAPVQMPSEMIKLKEPEVMVSKPMIEVSPAEPPAPVVTASVEAPMLKPIPVEPVIKRSVSSEDTYSPSFAAPSYSENRQAVTTVSDLRVPGSFSSRSRTSSKASLPARYTAKQPSVSRHSSNRRFN